MAIAAADYKALLQTLLPPGFSPDDSNVNQLLRAMAEEFARLDVRASDLTRDMLPAQTTELIVEWEQSLGLPDNCINPPRTLAGRRLEILSRLAAVGGQTPQYFTALAQQLGFNVTITEPALHTWDTQTDIATRRFRAGSPCGEPLRTYRAERVLECRFLNDKPAHTVATFTHINHSGETWVDKPSGTAVDLRSVWYDADTGLWVVVGNNGTILTSIDDGETWQPQVSGTTNSLRTVKKWKGTWIVVGHSDGITPATLLTSQDAINWTSIDIGGPDSRLVDIGFNDDKLLIMGFQFNPAAESLQVMTTDGINFTKTIDPAISFLYGIHWSEEEQRWGRVGSEAAVSQYFASSPDGVNWAVHNPGFPFDIWVIDYIDDTWIIGSGQGLVKTTTDRALFKTRNSKELTGENCWRITHSPQGVNLICGGFSTGRIMRSIDSGATWTQVYTNASGALMSKAIYGPGYWVAVGWGGKITKSTL